MDKIMDKITAARITKGKFMFDVPNVYVKFGNEEEEHFLFSYYPDEISFTADDFIGLTEEEARDLKGQRDRAYLRA